MPLLVLLFTLVLMRPDGVSPTVRCDDPGKCTLTAKRVDGSISIDGALDEKDWQRAPVATGFKQYEPREGAPASQRTEVRILYGARALYVGATLYDDQPDAIKATLGRRDELNQADWFIVAIDSYYDRKTAYNFAVNAAGVQLDGVQTGDLDTSWDAVWDASVRLTPSGWVVEMRIPYSMLRFTDSDTQRWGINFRRLIPRLSETAEWSLVRRTEEDSGPVSKYGILVGLRDLEPRRNVQVTPYTVSQVMTEEGDGGGLSSNSELDVGGDVKIGLTSNVTLDAAINPDFGQVESDPAVLNLTVFETFFAEKRPFFTEGVQIFDFDLDRGGRMLYTRRIGGRAPIIGATKLTGRTRRGLSFGVLGAATGHQFDPHRYYGAGRLIQEVGDYSRVGGIATAFDYSSPVGGDTPVRSATGGVDWDLRFDDNRYAFTGAVTGSHRMFPGLDASPETGMAAGVGVSKIQGLWTFSGEAKVLTDGFNPNDVGRINRVNYTNVSGGIEHELNGGRPFGPFRRASARLSGGNSWSYTDGIDLGLGLFAFSEWELRGFQEINLHVFSDYLFGGYTITETRGLWPRAKPREATFSVSYETDTRREWQLEPSFSIGAKSDGAGSLGVGLGADWNTSSRVTLSASVGYNKENHETAWVSNESFVLAEDGWAIGSASRSPDRLGVDDYHPFEDGNLLTDLLAPVPVYDDAGHYYVPVFGLRDTRSFDLTLRSNVTFTPTLSLQLYGQMFAARGRYRDFSLLTDKDTMAPFGPYPKQHDFSLSSFQTNAVLRWEYRPGSTLFVVWTQSRRGNDAMSPFDLARPSPFDQSASDQLRDTFRLFPTNVFLVKLTYKFLR